MDDKSYREAQRQMKVLRGREKNLEVAQDRYARSERGLARDIANDHLSRVYRELQDSEGRTDYELLEQLNANDRARDRARGRAVKSREWHDGVYQDYPEESEGSGMGKIVLVIIISIVLMVIAQMLGIYP